MRLLRPKTLRMKDGKVRIIWKPEFEKIFTKWDSGQLFSKSEDGEMEDDTRPKGGHAEVVLDAWIVTWSDNSIVGLCSPLGFQSNHDLNLDTKDALSEENLPLSWVNISPNRLTERDQVLVLKRYWLGMLNTELFIHNKPTYSRPSFHNKTQNTIANSLNSRSSKKLESQWLSSEPLQPVPWFFFPSYRGHFESRWHEW